MVFGPSNVLTISKRYINKILAKKLNIFIIIYLNDILIYMKNLEQLYIEAVCWILNQLQKYFFFANLKKCQFYLDEVYFLEYIILMKRINMKVKQIEIIKNWPKLKSVCNI